MSRMEHLRNLLDGLALFTVFGISDKKYIHPAGGFRRDRNKLKSDARKVGSDLRKAYRKHGKQVA